MKTNSKFLLALTATLSLAGEIQSNAQTAVVTPTPHYFTGTADIGLTFTRGNSRTETVTADINAEHKTNTYEVLLGAAGTYGRNTGIISSESIDGHGQYNRLVTDRFFYGVKVDAMADQVASIDYRLTVSPLVGYYFIKQTNMTLAGEVGPGAVIQKFGANSPHGYGTLRAAERFEYKFSATAKLWESFEILPQVDKFNNYYVNFEIGLEAALSKRWALRTYLDDTYYNIPAKNRLKNDVKLVSALAYKF